MTTRHACYFPNISSCLISNTKMINPVKVCDMLKSPMRSIILQKHTSQRNEHNVSYMLTPNSIIKE